MNMNEVVLNLFEHVVEFYHWVGLNHLVQPL